MEPQHWNYRSVMRLMNQINDSLDHMLYAMDRVESIMHQLKKMTPVWRELRESLIAEPQKTVYTHDAAPPAKGKYRKRKR